MRLLPAIHKDQIRFDTSRILRSGFPAFTLSGFFGEVSLLVCAVLLLGVVSSSSYVRVNFAMLLPIPSPAPAVHRREVFGFAPHWALKKGLNTVDFKVLTTLAYFGVPITAKGDMDTQNVGCKVFRSNDATVLFRKAHAHGTRVVLTITQMDNDTIETFLRDSQAQTNTIAQVVSAVEERGIDGINVDIEYIGDPGAELRTAFTGFVGRLTDAMHAVSPDAKVTVSVLASSAKYPKLYDIAQLSAVSDGIFMMAYDFAVTRAKVAMPTSPLYGYKEGKYWYDVSTAVEDFLKHMPREKLILGLPWYGYSYPVSSPDVKAPTNPGYTVWIKRGRRTVRSFVSLRGSAQAYRIAQETIHPDMSGINGYKTGWDEHGQVGWRAYYSLEDKSWRMIFLDDAVSLGVKYDFAKSHNLGGVGIWALGFEDGRSEMWQVLREKFGDKSALAAITKKRING